jgi:hypothetical protein
MPHNSKEVSSPLQQKKRGPAGTFLIPRAVTPDEMLSYLQFANMQVALAWKKKAQRVEGGIYWHMRPDGPLFQVIAHNEAKEWNGQNRLIQEFAKLVQENGHTVEFVPEPARELPKRVTETMADMVAANDVDEVEFDKMNRLIQNLKDAGNEKATVNRYHFLCYYGLTDVDQAFVTGFCNSRIEVPSRNRDLLLDVMLQGAIVNGAGAGMGLGGDTHTLLMVEYVLEVLTVLPLKHILDTSTETPPLQESGEFFAPSFGCLTFLCIVRTSKDASSNTKMWQQCGSAEGDSRLVSRVFLHLIHVQDIQKTRQPLTNLGANVVNVPRLSDV